MNVNEEAKGAQKIIELAEKLEMLTKAPGWNEFTDLIDQLLAQEDAALRGQEIDQKYYRRIGFTQMLLYIRAIPEIVKDKKTREYLLHQGRAKALETAKFGLINHYRKQKMFALDKIKQIFAGQNMEQHRREHGEQTFREQG